ncbi:hypothetical protein LRAMOSA09335 [Lichtheimia ramosa]|uniref:Uncharacterized protein n=1 Tax=Lichtheimia ramosa TaxID=688394 RepID=A0A077WHF6_9FUNG|nr:hypothetical protein LRAMOSA09335 [Lichtheimia ramosa]
MFTTTTHLSDTNDKSRTSVPSAVPLRYEEDDNQTQTSSGATFSTVAETADDLSSPSSSMIYEEYSSFEEEMTDPNNTQVSRYQNTYFMDGGNRFISLPTLGNTSKVASHVSRLFEEWLENKIYHHPSDAFAYDHLPILQDNPELLAEDIFNKLKSRPAAMTGMSRLLVKVRTGHVYTYHQLEDGQPLVTEDMEDFFQQFPLFVEVKIYSMASKSSSSTQLLLTVENAIINPEHPYPIMDEIHPSI